MEGAERSLRLNEDVDGPHLFLARAVDDVVAYFDGVIALSVSLARHGGCVVVCGVYWE